jgi:hypothetical protein
LVIFRSFSETVTGSVYEKELAEVLAKVSGVFAQVLANVIRN